MKAEDVKWVHLELSSKCNAWCPACVRNKNGFGLADNLVEQDLDLTILEGTLKNLPNLHAIQFCGNLGDPIAAKNINEAINISMRYVEKIQIHTNGGLRSTSWWHDLADQLKNINHDVWFGIDGLAGVHEIYRQGTTYSKVIKNAQAFINNSGCATWQFIPYSHNEHQIKDCLKESRKLGFKKFKLVKSLRNQPLARDYKSGQEYELSPPKEFVQSIVRMPKTNTHVELDNCMHLTMPSIYLAANGKFSYCCYKADSEKFDKLEDLFYTSVDLNNNVCLRNCGS